MCLSTFYSFIFSFYFFFDAFLPKITLGPWQGVGVGVHGLCVVCVCVCVRGGGGVICGHGHRAKKWRAVGQKVT